ncbi:MAG: hypothetical protein EBT92_15025 [Planctomycetes bacterium]|nr:hypothetical protein [Planctomycetota bacterium]NBY02523.1 hypothetical protein [Planctomycetota bacterium]
MVTIPVLKKQVVEMALVCFGKAIPEEAGDNLGLDPSERLRLLCMRGMHGMDAVVEGRLKQELQVIKQLNLSGFFLILWDIHRFASCKGHVIILDGPATSSLILHQLGLSPVNPIHHGLLFERFLDPNQAFAPSFQFSISEGGQEEVVRYAREKYGCDDSLKGNPDYLAYLKSWKSPATGKEDQLKINLIISPALTVLKHSIKLIVFRKKPLPDVVPTSDGKTLQLFKQGRTEGVYQFQGKGIQNLIGELRPESIEELSAAIAMYQGQSNLAEILVGYMAQKHGHLKRAPFHPSLEEILKETHGILIYHEQVMEIARCIGGLELREGFKLIKAICKEKEKEVDQIKERFLKGASDKQIETEMAEMMFGLILQRGKYTVCKANIIAAAIVAYQMGYLKAHYPEEFDVKFLESLNAKVMEELKTTHPELFAEY